MAGTMGTMFSATANGEVLTDERDATKVVRLTANLPRAVYDALRTMAAKNGVTMTEQLRRAISTERWFEEMREQGHRVVLEDANGKLREVIFK